MSRKQANKKVQLLLALTNIYLLLIHPTIILTVCLNARSLFFDRTLQRYLYLHEEYANLPFHQPNSPRKMNDQDSTTETTKLSPLFESKFKFKSCVASSSNDSEPEFSSKISV